MPRNPAGLSLVIDLRTYNIRKFSQSGVRRPNSGIFKGPAAVVSASSPYPIDLASVPSISSFPTNAVVSFSKGRDTGGVGDECVLYM